MKYWVVHVELHAYGTRVEVEECNNNPINCTGMRAYAMKAEAEAAAKRIIAADRELRRLIAENYDPVHLEQPASWQKAA